MSWVWDARVGRYRDAETGRYLSRQQVLAYVRESIDRTSVVSDQLAGYVSSGILSPNDWRDLFREELKSEYIRQYLLGIGGRDQMTQADWGRLGAMLREQYKYLNEFAKELEGLSPDQIMARARMYINSSREGFEKAHLQVAKRLGMTEELWVLGEAEHCDDCIGFASEDWQPIGHFPEPGAGDTQCLTNCQCHKLYRNPDTGVTL